MTYQEIIQAIESLPSEQQESLIETIQQQQSQKSNNDRSDLTPHSVDSNTNGKSTNDRSIYRAIERTPEETAEGIKKIKQLMEDKRDLWNNLTEAERNISDSQFAMVDEYIKQSRG